MDLFTPNPMAPGAVTALHSAATTNAYSSALDVGKHTLLTIQVSGTWTGAVKVQGEVGGTSLYAVLPVSDSNGRLIPNGIITGNGLYRINVAGYDKVRSRVEPASGSVDVSGRLSQGHPVQQGSRVVLIGRATNLEVAGGATTKLIDGVDTTPYAFVFAAARADATHDYTVKHLPQFLAPTFGQPDTYRSLLGISGSARGIGEWTEVVFPETDIYITNSDSSAHNYDVWFYGVR